MLRRAQPAVDRKGKNMKLKKVLALGAGLLLAFSLMSCGNDDSKAKNAGKAEGDTFTVGFDANFPPYGYKQGDEYVGFDMDLAQEVANRNGWKLVKQPIDWDSKDMELNSGTVDCLWNGFTLTGREDKYTWSSPYVDNSIVVVTKSDSGIKTLADLAGKVVNVQADSSGLAALKDAKNKDLVASFKELTEVAEYNTAFMNIEAGAADAIVVDLGVAHFQLDKRQAGAFTIMQPELQTEQYGIGFKLGNEALRDQVQNTLDEMRRDGTFLKLAEKYGLQDAVINEPAK